MLSVNISSLGVTELILQCLTARFFQPSFESFIHSFVCSFIHCVFSEHRCPVCGSDSSQVIVRLSSSLGDEICTVVIGLS